MEDEDIRLKRQIYLAQTIRKYTTTEPVLTLQELAVVISEEITELEKFLKKYIKEVKR